MLIQDMGTMSKDCCIDDNPTNCRIGEPELANVEVVTIVMVYAHHCNEWDEGRKAECNYHHHCCGEFKVDCCNWKQAQDTERCCKLVVRLFHNSVFVFCFIGIISDTFYKYFIVNVNSKINMFFSCFSRNKHFFKKIVPFHLYYYFRNLDIFRILVLKIWFN